MENKLVVVCRDFQTKGKEKYEFGKSLEGEIRQEYEKGTLRNLIPYLCKPEDDWTTEMMDTSEVIKGYMATEDAKHINYAHILERIKDNKPEYKRNHNGEEKFSLDTMVAGLIKHDIKHPRTGIFFDYLDIAVQQVPYVAGK